MYFLLINIHFLLVKKRLFKLKRYTGKFNCYSQLFR